MNRNINWWLIGTIAFFVLFIYLLGPILTPFLIAGLLAYLGDPLVNRLTRFKVPRSVAAIIVFFSFVAIISLSLLLIIPLLERQIIILINKIPIGLSWLQQVFFPWISQQLGIKDVTDASHVKSLLSNHLEQASNVAAVVWKTITHSSYTVFVFLLNLILIPIVTFYLLRDWDGVQRGMKKLLPRAIEPTVMRLTKECNDVIGAFFRGQLLVMLVLGIYYAISLSIAGLELALLIGIITGLISIVPYLGFTIGILIALIAALIQFHAWAPIVYVLVIFGIGHVLENYVLYPWLVGDRIGLHPVLVIFAILAGGQLFGFLGVLLALPVAAVIMVGVRYLINHYLKSNWYAKARVKAH